MPVRRFGIRPEPLRDPKGRWRWGERIEETDTAQEVWSIMHTTTVGGVALPDPYDGEAPFAMMIGLWTDSH